MFYVRLTSLYGRVIFILGQLANTPLFLTEISDFCYKDSIPGRRGKKSILFMQFGLGRQHTGIGHILCTDQTVECSMSCSNLDTLWNQAMSTYMKYMLPIGFLAVTFSCEEVSKFGVEMCFFIVFDNIAASLHHNLKRYVVREYSHMPHHNA